MDKYAMLERYGDALMNLTEVALNGGFTTLAFVGDTELLRFYAALTVDGSFDGVIAASRPLYELAKIGGICFLEVYRKPSMIFKYDDGTALQPPGIMIWSGDIAYDPTDDLEIEQIWQAAPNLRIAQ